MRIITAITEYLDELFNGKHNLRMELRALKGELRLEQFNTRNYKFLAEHFQTWLEIEKTNSDKWFKSYLNEVDTRCEKVLEDIELLHKDGGIREDV